MREKRKQRNRDNRNRTELNFSLKFFSSHSAPSLFVHWLRVATKLNATVIFHVSP